MLRVAARQNAATVRSVVVASSRRQAVAASNISASKNSMVRW